MEAEAAVLPLYAKGRWPSPEAKRDKEELSLTGFRERERAWPHRNLDCRLLVSKTVKEYSSVGSSHLGCGTFLRRP